VTSATAPPAAGPSPVHRRPSVLLRVWWSDTLAGWAFISPTVLLIGLFGLVPVVWAFVLSFEQNDLISPGKWVGLDNYRKLLHDPAFSNSVRNTVVYTAVATLIAIVLTTCYAYVISKKHLRGRGVMIGIAVFTMFFNGGIIPNYVLITSLGLKNTLWAIVLPNAISVFNLLIMKSFFENMPVELEEAAAIDGLNTYGILFRIVLPLSKAVLATMILFYAVMNWNAWFGAFLYLDKSELFPVTIYLRNLIAGASAAGGVGGVSENATQIASNIKSVTMVLSVLPILAVYPFVQKYFVSGVMLGAVKQ